MNLIEGRSVLNSYIKNKLSAIKKVETKKCSEPSKKLCLTNPRWKLLKQIRNKKIEAVRMNCLSCDNDCLFNLRIIVQKTIQHKHINGKKKW